jgi:glycosyltransferase involved in cell wall biosynthesis
MIHLVIREPLEYQRTLCQALNDAHQGRFVAWFATNRPAGMSNPGETFASRFLPEVGYATLFRELNADAQPIVILGGWSGAFAWITLLITRVLRVPVFIWADHPHPRKRPARLRRWYLRLLNHQVSGLLACGQPTMDHVASLGFERSKITNFPYWVRLPEDWRLPPGGENNQSEQPIRLLTVGRLVSVKAFDVAIKAVAMANEGAGNEIATLEVIGEGVERQRLEDLTTTLGAHGAIRFSGWVSNDEVCHRLRNSDALIVPSRFEPYGVVVLEALASGRPVLSSDQVVAALDRDDGKGAIFFHPAGDAATLADQIKFLAGNRDVLARSAAAARSNAEQWPPARAAAILLPLLEQAYRRRRRQNAGELAPDYEVIDSRSAQPTSDPS